MGRRESPGRIALGAASTAATSVLVLLLVAFVAIPAVTGGAALTVRSGSMEPAFAAGDVVVVRGIDSSDVCAEVGIGDIIAYLPRPGDPTLVTHRAVAKAIGTFDDGTECRVIAKGDANSAADDPISPHQVRGVFLFGVPHVGWARQWAGENLPLLIAVAAIVLIGVGAWSGARRPRARVVTAQTTEAGIVIVRSPEGRDVRSRVLAGTLAVLLLLVGACVLALTGALPFLSSAAPAIPGVVEASVRSLPGGTVTHVVSSGGRGAASAGPSGALHAEWDGPTTALDWAGTGYAVATSSFAGERIVSPGDRVERTLIVRNDGPSGGLLRVRIVLGQGPPSTPVGRELADALNVHWDVDGLAGGAAVRALRERSDDVVAELFVARHQEVAITAGVELPAAVTDARRRGDAAAVEDFDVVVTLTGDTLARTGSEFGSPVWAALALGAAFSVTGAWVLVAARRRRHPTSWTSPDSTRT